MDPVNQAVAIVSEKQDGGAPAVEPVSAGQGTVDWENESNPYKAKFTGLQGNFRQVQQQSQAQIQEYQRQVEQANELMVTLQGQTEGLTPEQLNTTIQGHRQRQQVEGFLRNLAAERQIVQEEAKPAALAKIAKQYGVEVADLEDAPSPEVAIFLATKLAAKGRTDNLQARKADGVDVGETGGGGSPSWDRMSASEKIRAGVAQELRRNRSG